MLKAYGKILEAPGAWQFSLAAALARFPMSMQAFSIIMMVSLVYNQYALAGQVNAVAVVCYAVGTPVLARLVDRYGQSRVVRPAVMIYAIAFVALLVLAITKQPEFVLYVAAAFLGFFGCSFGAYVRARWTNVLSSARQLNTAFAMEAAIDEVIWLIGPVVATVLVQSVHPTAGGTLCIIMAVFGGMWFLSQKATEPPIQDPSTLAQEDKRPLLKNVALVTLCLIFVTGGTTFGALDISVVAFSRDIGKPQWAGILLAFTAAGSLVSAIIYGSRDWPISPLRLFIIGMALMALGFTAFLWATNLPMMAFCMVLCGVTYAPTMTNATNILREVVPAARFTEGMAWFATSWTVGNSIGTSICGNVLDEYGWYGGLIMTVLMAMVMLLFVIVGAKPLAGSLARARRRRQVRMDLALEMTHEAAEKFRQEEAVKYKIGREKWRRFRFSGRQILSSKFKRKPDA